MPLNLRLCGWTSQFGFWLWLIMTGYLQNDRYLSKVLLRTSNPIDIAVEKYPQKVAKDNNQQGAFLNATRAKMKNQIVGKLSIFFIFLTIILFAGK